MAEVKTVNVAAAIFYKDNKILAACRADADNAGFWEFPGGKVEAGETSEQALSQVRLQSKQLSEKFRKSCTVVCRQRFSMTR